MGFVVIWFYGLYLKMYFGAHFFTSSGSSGRVF